MSSNKKSTSKKRCEGCETFIYNKADGSFCGRTPKAWCLLLIFYIIFFSCLAGFFALLLYIFMNFVIIESCPYLTGQQSILFSQAGINVYPRTSVEEALIIISTNSKDIQTKKYVDAITKFFNNAFITNSNKGTTCATDLDQPNDVSMFCTYQKDELGPCKDPLGQMKIGLLCVFIRMNKVYGWLPDVANMTSSKDILLDCKGQNPGDVVNLREPVYYPTFSDGLKSYGLIPNKYFPFINQKGYVSPMVAIQFPQMKNNTAILIQCQTRNLNNSFKNVKFEVMVIDRKI